MEKINEFLDEGMKINNKSIINLSVGITVSALIIIFAFFMTKKYLK